MGSVLSKQKSSDNSMKKAICLNPMIKNSPVIEAVVTNKMIRKKFRLYFVFDRSFM